MKLSQLSAALVAAGLALPALAAPDDAATLKKLLERMEKLEARNAELEKKVKTLEGESEEIAKGLDSPRLSQYEPELTVRLKAVEKDALEMKRPPGSPKVLKGSRSALRWPRSASTRPACRKASRTAAASSITAPTSRSNCRSPRSATSSTSCSPICAWARVWA